MPGVCSALCKNVSITQPHLQFIILHVKFLSLEEVSGTFYLPYIYDK